MTDEKQETKLVKRKEASAADDVMTTAERAELSRVVRLRATVRRSDVEVHAAEQRADVEKQLATIYKKDDPRWSEITKMADDGIAEVLALLGKRLEQLGIEKELGPTIVVGWSGRGENAFAGRRAELRKVAYSEIEANAKSAKVQIDRVEATLLEKIAARGLRTDDARQFLTSIPTIEAMMPALDVGELDKKQPKPKDGYDWRYLSEHGIRLDEVDD
jgi:hypothetical protein